MHDAMEAVRAGTEFDFLFGRWTSTTGACASA